MKPVEVLSAIELIRERPDMYFRTGAPRMEELISRVLEDVGGRADFVAEVIRDDPFAMVSANYDWMRTDRAAIEELFDRFVIPTPMVPNSHRAEVLLVAVCDGVATRGEIGDYMVGLDWARVPDAMRERANTAARVLVWRFRGGSPGGAGARTIQ